MIGQDAAMGGDRLLRLAEWLADPAGWFAGDDGLPPDHRAALAASPMLRPALNRHLSRHIGIPGITMADSFVAALAQDDDTARATALATASGDHLHRAAQYLGAALCQNRLRTAVLRSERDRLTALLGDDAMAFGLRRAPLLARALQDLPLATSDDPLAAGRRLCASLIRRASPTVHAIFRLRQSAPDEPVDLSDPQARAGWAVLGAAS